MQAYRAAILRFAPDHTAIYDADGLLVVSDDGKVAAVGDYSALRATWGHVPSEQHPGKIIAPGFVDMHVHYPQIDVIGSPADGLLPWLENHTFPEEKRFESHEYSAQAAHFL